MVSPDLWRKETQVKPRGRQRPVQVTGLGGKVAEEGRSPERPQSKLNHPAPQPLDKGRDGGDGREGR